MVDGIGVLHSTVEPEDIRKIINDFQPDHIFVEGSTPEHSTKVLNNNFDEIVETVNEKIKPKFDVATQIENEIDNINGKEGTYLLETEKFPRTSITFLDEELELTKQKYLYAEELDTDKEDKELPEVSKNFLKAQIDDNSVTKADLERYTNYRINNGDPSLIYAALTNEEIVQAQLREVAETLDSNDAADTLRDAGLDMDIKIEYSDDFMALVNEYDIGLEELQSLIGKERSLDSDYEDFQNFRDCVWYDQISNYVDNNPEDNIVVIAGLDHFLDLPGRLTDNLQNNDYDVNVYPLKAYEEIM